MLTTTSPTATARLDALYRAPGPYLTAIVNITDDPGERVAVFEARREELLAAGASPQAVEAVSARLALRPPPDSGAQIVIAAADGSTIGDFGSEGPAEPFVVVETLPYAAPLLEWDQWRVGHLVVTIDDEIELTAFTTGEPPARLPAPSDEASAADAVVAAVSDLELDLVVIGGGSTARSRAFADRVVGQLPVRTSVEAVDSAECESPDSYATAVVRVVADHVARQTVAALEEFRFLAERSDALDGPEASLRALAEGRGTRLLVHDDPRDDRRARFGMTPHAVGMGPTSSLPHEGRLVDVAIWSALRQGMQVRVIPSTGDNGPDGNIAVLVDAEPAPRVS